MSLRTIDVNPQVERSIQLRKDIAKLLVQYTKETGLIVHDLEAAFRYFESGELKEPEDIYRVRLECSLLNPDRIKKREPEMGRSRIQHTSEISTKNNRNDTAEGGR